MTTIACPICGQRYDIESFEEDAIFECQKCGQSFALASTMIVQQETNIEEPTEQPQTEIVPETPISTAATPSSPATTYIPIKFTPPILTRIFRIMAVLSGIATFMGILASIDAHSDDSVIALLSAGGLLITTFLFLGCAEVVTYIAEIRFHSIIQTELLEKLLDSKMEK